MATYTEKLKDPRWQKKRLQIMSRDKFTCKLCKDTETTLNVHHKNYINNLDPWKYTDKDLITICDHCHREISQNEFKNIPFDQISIYKSTRWDGGSMLIFMSIYGICSMSIYDKSNQFIVGFNIADEELKSIIKIFKKAII